MLKEKDLDIVLVGTPDHWHALAAIAAMEAGADVYVQKPIGVDVVEGQAMLATARRLGRVVQVGTQRRSTPHLIEARDRVIKEGNLGRVAQVEICCYWHMRASGNPPDIAPPDYLDYELWTGPAPKRPFSQWMHPRGWRAFMEYGNGIVGDMGIHMYDMTRWMLDLGWPKSVSSTGGILVDKGRGRTSLTRRPRSSTTATCRSSGSTAPGARRRTRNIPGAPRFTGDKGTLKASVFNYDFFTRPGKQASPQRRAASSSTKVPRGQNGAGPGTQLRLGHPLAHAGFPAAIASRGKPVADIEQGHISTTSCILANHSMKLGRACLGCGKGRDHR